MITDEMVERAKAAYSKATGCDDTPHVLEGWIDDALRAALSAALSVEPPTPQQLVRGDDE